MARILAEAAAIYDHKNAIESFSLGSEAKGPASRAEILISDKAITGPLPEMTDFFLALTQRAFDKHAKDAGPESVLVTESRIDVGDAIRGRKLYSAPFAEIAKRECGRSSMANIVALGFFARMNNLIDQNSIRKAILGRIPKLSEECYIKAYEAGLKAAENALGEDTE